MGQFGRYYASLQAVETIALSRIVHTLTKRGPARDRYVRIWVGIPYFGIGANQIVLTRIAAQFVHILCFFVCFAGFVSITQAQIQ